FERGSNMIRLSSKKENEIGMVGKSREVRRPARRACPASISTFTDKVWQLETVTPTLLHSYLWMRISAAGMEGFHKVAEAGLKLGILLPQLPELLGLQLCQQQQPQDGQQML
ncbi:hypothetical protein H1C71_019216, partial [Ictidomys tridecemlineatus]